MKNTYLIVGSGRLARHLKFWLGLKGANLRSWDRSQDPHLLLPLINQSTHILLAVSDSAILPVFQRYFAGHGKIAVHFSGAQSFPAILGAHPLMTFSSELYDGTTYDRVSWAVEGQHTLEEIFPELENSYFNITAEQKPFYHALCVASGNLPQIIWSLVEAEGTRLGITREMWISFWEKSLQNFSHLGKQAITGPFSRGDQTTLLQNLKALSESATPLAEIYKSFLTIQNSGDLKPIFDKETPRENYL